MSEDDEPAQLLEMEAAVYAASVPKNLGGKSLRKLLPGAVKAMEVAADRGLPLLTENIGAALPALVGALESSTKEA